MARPTLVKLEQPKPQPVADLVKELKTLLADAEAGKIRSVAYAADVGDRDPVLCIAGEWEMADLVFAVTRLSNLVDESDDD